MDGRRKVTTIVGEVEIGKTTQALGIINPYEHGMVTIHDYQGEPQLQSFPEIGLDQMRAQKSGKYRVSTSDWKTFIDHCLYNYRIGSDKKGMIYFDDMSSWVPQAKYQPLHDLMTGLRHKHLDILSTHHHLWRVPPYVMDDTHYLVIMKTGEAPDKGDVKRFKHGQRILEAFERVAASTNKHALEVVKLYGV